MTDRFNTIAGWLLFAGIVALGATVVTGEVYRAERPEKMGYPIPGVEAEGEGEGEAEQPIEALLAAADPAKGEAVFKKCTACHTIDKGAANMLGPNLWGTMGKPLASHPGFAYSDALKSKGGTWTWQNMSEWLKSPKSFAPGTKMTFAGLGSAEDRANLMAFLNSKSDSPLPLPAAPAAAPAAGADQPANANAPGSGQGDGAQKAENEPVLNEQKTGPNPKNVGGEAATNVTNPDAARR